MQATWQRLPLLFICLYRFFSLSSFFLFIYLFFPSNGTRHCATCQIVAAGRERGEKNKYRLHVCVGVCVCVCAGVVGKHKTMCVCVCVCVCEWGRVLWTFTAWYLCAAVKWAHCTEKKKKKEKKKREQSVGRGIGGRPANQNTSRRDLLNCLVVSRRLGPSILFFFKKWPGVAEMRPNAPSQSIKSSSGLFACSLRRTGTTTVLCG